MLLHVGTCNDLNSEISLKVSWYLLAI